jgi:hypothetical protein
MFGNSMNSPQCSSFVLNGQQPATFLAASLRPDPNRPAPWRGNGGFWPLKGKGQIDAKKIGPF